MGKLTDKIFDYGAKKKFGKPGKTISKFVPSSMKKRVVIKSIKKLFK